MIRSEDKATRDAALLERWRRGDEEAGVALLAHYKAGFHGLCLRLGIRGQDDMLELFQDVVLATIRALPSLPDKLQKSFSGWFFWQVRDAIGRRRRAAPATAEFPASLEADATPADARVALREAIERCRKRLPPVEQQVFELRYLKGLSLQESARIVGNTANAIGQSIFRLSRKMRECLAAAGFERGSVGPAS